MRGLRLARINPFLPPGRHWGGPLPLCALYPVRLFESMSGCGSIALAPHRINCHRVEHLLPPPLARVQALEADQTPRRYSIDDLRAIRNEYRAKQGTLKKGRGDA